MMVLSPALTEALRDQPESVRLAVLAELREPITTDEEAKAFVEKVKAGTVFIDHLCSLPDCEQCSPEGFNV